MVKQRILSFIIITISGILFYACASSGAMSSNGSQEYNRDFNSMTKLVERAINGSNINIDYVSDSKDGRMVLTVSRDRYVNNEEVQQEQGEVRIIRVSENKTRVEVDNPEYHFSVPEHQREDYQRIIFLRISNLLNK